MYAWCIIAVVYVPSMMTSDSAKPTLVSPVPQLDDTNTLDGVSRGLLPV